VKTLLETLSICTGIYFAAYSGRLLVLRDAGHTSLFKFLEAVTGYLPFLSVGVLLTVGIIAVLRESNGKPCAIAVKVPLILIIALVPQAVHMAMYSLTYTTGASPQRTLYGSLSRSEWLIFLVGFLLLGVGTFLLLRVRKKRQAPEK